MAESKSEKEAREEQEFADKVNVSLGRPASGDAIVPRPAEAESAAFTIAELEEETSPEERAEAAGAESDES